MRVLKTRHGVEDQRDVRYTGDDGLILAPAFVCAVDVIRCKIAGSRDIAMMGTTNMTRKLRLGILGCARISRRGLIPGTQRSRSAELAAIASRDGTKARAWAVEFGIPGVHESYEAMLADPHIDAVYVPLPNELHRTWVLQAAAAGKHVLCEKPLGTDLADAQAMVDGCRAAGVVLMEAFMWRHHPRVTTALRMLRDGQLGELRLVKMDFSFPIDLADWRLDPQRGGGALFDLGCYGINAARLFTGEEPRGIESWAHFHPGGVDLTLAMCLQFSRNVIALLDCSFECPSRNRLEIVGTKGSLEFPGGVLPAEQAVLLHTHGDQTDVIPFGLCDQYAEEVDIFVQGCREGRLPSPAEDGLANMAVLDAVLNQARGRAPR